jgi:hypothetical protein
MTLWLKKRCMNPSDEALRNALVLYWRRRPFVPGQRTFPFYGATKRRLRGFCLAVLLVAAADAACAYLWFRSVTREFAPVRDASAQAAIVPFSGFRDMSGLDPETHRTLVATVALYKDKRIRYVRCVGGARPDLRAWGAERMKQVL